MQKTHTRKSKLLAILLTLAITLIPAFTLTANALEIFNPDNPESFNRPITFPAVTPVIEISNSSTVSKISSGIYINFNMFDLINSNEMTIRGSNISRFPNSMLTLDIPSGKTLIWEAEYSGNAGNQPALINITGGGTFVISPGALITRNDSGTVISTTTATIEINGGTIVATDDSCYAIDSSGRVSINDNATISGILKADIIVANGATISVPAGKSFSTEGGRPPININTSNAVPTPKTENPPTNTTDTPPVTKVLSDGSHEIKTDSGTLTVPPETMKHLQETHGANVRLSVTKGKVALIGTNGREIAFNNADYPMTLTLPYSLTDEQSADAVVAVRKDGSRNVIMPYSLYNEKTKEVTLEITQTGTYDVIFNAKGFTDITEHWAESYINFITSRNLEMHSTEGTDKFSPEQRISRAMLALMFARLDSANLSSYRTSKFDDVPNNQWYTGAVEWAAEKGIMSGVSDNRFTPNAMVTPAEMTAMLESFIKYKGWNINASKLVAFENPSEFITRAEFCAVFARLIQAAVK